MGNMGEQPRFGVDSPEHIRQTKPDQLAAMFTGGEELPLFSGTPIPAIERPFVPEDQSMKQMLLPDMPPVDYDLVLEKDRALRRQRAPGAVSPGDNIFSAVVTAGNAPAEEAIEPARTQEDMALVPKVTPEHRRSPRERTAKQNLQRLHESLAPYVDTAYLRQLAARQLDLRQALRSDNPPAEVLALIDTLSALLRPEPRLQIKSPVDVVGLLLVEMGHLDQEELRTVLLDTKNRVQDVVTIYRSSLNISMVRVGEVFRPAIRRNSAAIIVAHNHPSGDPTPSPEDVLVTHEIVKAGILLDTECLDHIVIGQGKWVSLRERGLGFTKS